MTLTFDIPTLGGREVREGIGGNFLLSCTVTLTIAYSRMIAKKGCLLTCYVGIGLTWNLCNMILSLVKLMRFFVCQTSYVFIHNFSLTC